MSLEEFPPLLFFFFGRVWKGLVLIPLWMPSRIRQRSHLVLDLFVGRFLITHSTSLLVISLSDFLYFMSTWKWGIGCQNVSSYISQPLPPIVTTLPLLVVEEPKTSLSFRLASWALAHGCSQTIKRTVLSPLLFLPTLPTSANGMSLRQRAQAWNILRYWWPRPVSPTSPFPFLLLPS